MSTSVDIHLETYRHWHELRSHRAMPSKVSLDPAHIRTLLPHLTLIDILPDGQFRYRLVGTRVTADFGREVTGTVVGSHVQPTRYAREICASYSMVCVTLAPIFTTGVYRTGGGSVQEVSRLLLPLGSTDRSVEVILVSRVARSPINLDGAANIFTTSEGSLERAAQVDSVEFLAELVADWDSGAGSTHAHFKPVVSA